MAFLHNRTVNLLNLHYIIGSVATNGGGAFLAVWLFRSGLRVSGVLLALAAIFSLRLFIRSFLMPFAIRFGLRALLVVGTVLMGMTYIALAQVNGANITLAALIFMSALGDSVYWPSFHAYFAALGDAEHRAQQIGVREGATVATGIVSPLATGWLLITYGPHAAFYASAVIQALAAIPIAFTPDVRVARRAPGAFRAALSGFMLFVGDGWVASGYILVWQIALFLALSQNTMAYGGALAISALVGAVSGLFLGRLIDSGRGVRAVWIAGAALTAVLFMRAGAAGHPLLAVVANALGAFVNCLYIPTMMTAVYNQAKRSPCVMRFHMAAEAGWDIGVSSGLALAAFAVWRGLPAAVTILISLGGAAFALILLYRYYAAHPAEVVDASQREAEEAAMV